MNDKNMMLSNLFAFGFGCIVIGQMVWSAIHYWDTWHAWTFCGLGVLNITTLTFMVRSHLRWFDSRLAFEYEKGRLDMLDELCRMRAEHE